MWTRQAWTLGSAVLVFAAQAPTMGTMRLRTDPDPQPRGREETQGSPAGTPDFRSRDRPPTLALSKKIIVSCP